MTNKSTLIRNDSVPAFLVSDIFERELVGVAVTRYFETQIPARQNLRLFGKMDIRKRGIARKCRESFAEFRTLVEVRPGCLGAVALFVFILSGVYNSDHIDGQLPLRTIDSPALRARLSLQVRMESNKQSQGHDDCNELWSFHTVSTGMSNYLTCIHQ